MIRITGRDEAARSLKASLFRFLFGIASAVVACVVFYWLFMARVAPDEFGVEQKRVGFKTGIVDTVYGPGLYFVPPGTTMHTFPRVIHVLEATYDQEEATQKARGAGVQERVRRYFDQRAVLLGGETHRVVDALNIQTSDGYAVKADVTLLYSIAEPLLIAKQFGWGALYIDAFVINTFRNGVLTTLGKMNAETFYDEQVRIAAIQEAESVLRERFAERGFKVERLLIRNYQYVDNYEKSLHDKKVAVQLTVKNRKEGLVNEERAELQQIESKGNAAITIAESGVKAEIARIRAEAGLYSAQVRAKADTEVNVSLAEAKRLKAEALTTAGGRYVVALETAKMFDSIESAVMTPEQYIAFIRSAWTLIGVSPGTGGSAAPPSRPGPASGGGQ